MYRVFRDVDRHSTPVRPWSYGLSLLVLAIGLLVLHVRLVVAAEAQAPYHTNTRSPHSELWFFNPPAITPELSEGAPKTIWQPPHIPPTPSGGKAFLPEFREPQHLFDILGPHGADSTGIYAPLEIPRLNHTDTANHANHANHASRYTSPATIVLDESMNDTPRNGTTQVETDPPPPPPMHAARLDSPDDNENSLLLNALQFAAILLACLAAPVIYKVVQRQMSGG